MPAPVSMYIKLGGDVATVLGRVSRRERRNPRDQAALFIEDALRRAGELNDLGALPLDVTAYREIATSQLPADHEPTTDRGIEG